MNIAALFVRRPVMTALVMLGFLIFGIVAYRLLPMVLPSEMPKGRSLWRQR